MHKTHQLNHQKGGTFIGMVIVIAAIVFFAMLGLKLAPAYMEFMNVKNIIKKIANNDDFNNMSKKEIALSFDKHASIDDIRRVRGADLIVEKTDAGSVITVEYQVVVPIMANASALLDFNATSAK
jgi:DNA gyrase/topoisomerase IV subunit A